MDRREWYSDSDREYACIYHRDDCFQGGIGLLTFTGLKEPESVDSPEGPLCIAANGYQWLELVPEGGHFALTAMFHDGVLFEQYTDITLRNEVSENGDAAFYDLLLDVVVLSDGTPRILDREELEEALSGGVITRKDPLLPPPIPPSIRVFSNESALLIRWPKYCSFSFNISPSNGHSD